MEEASSLPLSMLLYVNENKDRQRIDDEVIICDFFQSLDHL